MIHYITFSLRMCLFLPCNLKTNDGKRELHFNKIIALVSLLSMIGLIGISLNQIVTHFKYSKTEYLYQITHTIVVLLMYFQYISILLYQTLYVKEFIALCNALYIIHDCKIKLSLRKMVPLFTVILIVKLCAILSIVQYVTGEYFSNQVWYLILDTHRTINGIILAIFFDYGIQLLATNLEDTVTEHCIFPHSIINDANYNFEDLSTSVIIHGSTVYVTIIGANQIFHDVIMIEKIFKLMMNYFKFPILLMIIYDGSELILSLIYIGIDNWQYRMWLFILPCFCRIIWLLKAPTNFIAVVSIKLKAFP